MLLLKARLLCTTVPNQILETVLGRVEMESFITLPGKGGHPGLLKNLCVLTWKDVMRDFITVVQGQVC